MSRLYLVACTKLKAAERKPAVELYMASDWFAKARAYVESQMGPGDEWRILSAAHGLVAPWRPMDPYDQTLVGVSREGLRNWASTVLGQLITEGLAPRGRTIVFLAGQNYRGFLASWLEKSGSEYTVEAPLAGLGLGQQKAWLKQHTTKGA